MSWLGHANTKFYTKEDQSISLIRKDAANSGHISFSTFCEQIIAPCNLNPLLFNGHLQTLWTVTKEAHVPVFYKRGIFAAEDPCFPGNFAVDFVVPEFADGDASLPPRTKHFQEGELSKLNAKDCKPMLVVLHGLSGGSHELYVRSVIKPLFESGWEVCVVNSRGCAGSQITTPILYNARATWDVRQTVKWLRTRFPNRPLYAVGFSLGANILVNYLGEEGDRCNFRAAVVVSNPWNLEVSSLALQRTWLGLEVYSRAMGRNMRHLFEKYVFAAPTEGLIRALILARWRHVTAVSENTLVDVEKVRGITYLHEFDRELQCPTWSYPTEGAYYRDASSCDAVLAVRIPLLALNAENDPIAVKEAIPFREIMGNPYVVLCTTSNGGHLGWFEIGGGRWFVNAICRFLRQIEDDMSPGKLPKKMVEVQAQGWMPSYLNTRFVPMRRKLKYDSDIMDGVE